MHKRIVVYEKDRRAVAFLKSFFGKRRSFHVEFVDGIAPFREVLSKAGRTGGLKAKGRLKPGLNIGKAKLQPPSSNKEEDKEKIREEDTNSSSLLLKYNSVIVLSKKISTYLGEQNSSEILKSARAICPVPEFSIWFFPTCANPSSHCGLRWKYHLPNRSGKNHQV